METIILNMNELREKKSIHVLSKVVSQDYDPFYYVEEMTEILKTIEENKQLLDVVIDNQKNINKLFEVIGQIDSPTNLRVV